MQNFRNLLVWKKSHDLALAVYRLSVHLQKREAWTLRDQMFRAVISIPSNIAEGRGTWVGCRFQAVFVDCPGVIQ